MRRILLSRRWLPRHALLLVVVTAFALLGRWQLQRAEGGNARSIGYAFEWPLFAMFAVFWWWRTMRMELHPPPQQPPLTSERRSETSPAGDSGDAADSPEQPEEPDDALTAYNRYLAWLHEQDQRPAR